MCRTSAGAAWNAALISICPNRSTEPHRSKCGWRVDKPGYGWGRPPHDPKPLAGLTVSEPSILGRVDRLADGYVGGWLLRLDGGPQRVELLLGDALVMEAETSVARPDIRHPLAENIAPGFRIQLEQFVWQALLGGEALTVRAAGTDRVLQGVQTAHSPSVQDLVDGWPEGTWEISAAAPLWNLRQVRWQADEANGLIIEGELHSRGLAPLPIQTGEGTIVEVIESKQMALPATWVALGLEMRRVRLRIPMPLAASLTPVRLGPVADQGLQSANWVPPALARLAISPDLASIRRVVGELGDPQIYMTGGWSLASLCVELIGPIMPKGGRLLDWGCGPGRLLGPFHSLLPGWECHGCELDATTLAVAERLHPQAKIAPSRVFPELPYPSGSFDAVIGISVMSHMAEPAQHVWLAELRRLLRPGGLAILTTHNLLQAFALSDEGGTRAWVLRELKRYGLSDCLRDGNLGPHLPLGSLYRSVFHTEAHLHTAWGRYFQILRVFRGAMELKQDVWLMLRD